MLSDIFRSALTLLSPRLNTEVVFFFKFHRRINLKAPQTLNEKILKLKLDSYGTDPLIRQCADKYAVRAYVEDKGFRDILIPLLAAYDRAEDIDWDALPDAFALKWNFGCGFNLICRDKHKLNREAAVRQLEKWGRKKYYLGHSEMQYKNVPPKLLVEQYIGAADGSLPEDYKFYCFNGEPLAILYMAGRNTEQMQAAFFDPDWNLIGTTGKSHYHAFEAAPQPPASLHRMVEIARALAKDFTFVRVDLYDIDGKPFFGELTFTPAGGFDVSQCEINGHTMGELLKL